MEWEDQCRDLADQWVCGLPAGHEGRHKRSEDEPRPWLSRGWYLDVDGDEQFDAARGQR